MTEKNLKPIASQDHGYARKAFTDIAFARAFEQAAWDLTQINPPRVPGSMHFCAGQEAVPFGAAAGLGPDDQIIATYRGHGWALASGLPARAVMAEICQKAEGVNGGRGGSPYIMAPDTRFIGENSIVGAGTTIACGVAMANLAQENGRVVIVSIGDGATNQGAVHEAMSFAAIRALPVIFVVENNGWAELTPAPSMLRVDRVAQRASSYGIPSATIDGSDPIAVRDSMALAAEHARKGDGPSLLEFRVPRLWGHYNRDIEHYRPKADRAEAEARDPLTVFGARIVASGIMTDTEVEALVAEQTQAAREMTEAVMDGPDPDPQTALDHVLAKPSAADPGPVHETVELKYIDAVNRALRTALEQDEAVLVYGEDVGNGGGIFGGSRYLQRDFGAARVFDTPIAENAILGSAVGAAMCGMKPVVEIMWADFLFVALDQIVNQAANIRYLTQGKVGCPMVVRTQQGVTPGSCAQHSQSVEALLAHVPGIKVGLAATPGDAYAMLRAAIDDPDPAVVIEARGLYQTKGEVLLTDGSEGVGKAKLRREGSDIALITWGTMLPHVLDAAETLAGAGVEASVLDLRWLNPLDETALVDVVRAAGARALIVHEAVRTGGFAGEIALRLTELLKDEGLSLDIRRHTTPDVRMPSSAILQAALLPSGENIAEFARDMLEHGSAEASDAA
ncbi:thiamine pyrophosphate-dependent enzyme [Thalassococcus sp. S3]|uniref:alpha-ketoacid dehydrogenase subunit alpha/beta n=1 Tax=Thalassococcus sp. S3 TaxID=2017482 RepID=UPI0010247EFE|nr:alpha-ketoacid dehydrogenase subunit alpha/beta [Thalassococcus sp. S3]QBF30810.1 transketolase [Thalassococcus sp. S3]